MAIVGAETDSTTGDRTAPNPNKPKGNWRTIFGEVRTRVIIWHVLLVALSAVISLFTIRQILFARLEERIEKSLVQEIAEFRRLAAGRNPYTGKPFGNDAAAIFDVFLSRNVPSDDEFFIALVDGQFYKSSPSGLPKALETNSGLLKEWAKLSQPKQGTRITPEGTVLYIAEPVRIPYRVNPAQPADTTLGMFIVAHVTRGEQEEVHEAVTVVIQVTIVVLALTSLVAWVAAGKVLAPLHLLAETVRSVSENDLTRRIPVQGGGEIADLAATFNEMMDRLQSAFTSQQDFVNDAGHELRTPITIIRGHLELMSDDPVDQQETRSLVIDELDRMNRIVDDLLLLAKAERPDFLQLETLDAGSFTEELFAKARALADRNWKLDSKTRGNIVIDRQRITEAVMNLAQNATQYTGRGDTIALGSVIVRDKIRFWVRDTGEGIAPEDQQRIFQRFARASNSRRRSEGAGLGLSIVEAIVQAHGGEVILRSHLQVGSTFIIVLPLEPL
jgi:signal transduction histidine kinase